MTDRDLTDLLASFGLTEKEAATYVAIVEHGETTVSEVAEEAGVSTRHVYNTAVRLEEAGFVEVTDFVTPTRLRPVPPDRVRERLREDVDTLYGELIERVNRTDRDLGPVQVLKSGATLVKRIRRYVADAEASLFLAIPHSLLPELDEELKAAVDRGIFVLLIVYGDVAPEDEEVRLDGIAHAVRVRWDELPVQMTVDWNFGLIAPHELFSAPGEENQAVALGHPSFEPVIYGNFLSNEWKFAEELYVHPPEALPAEYSNFRFATMQAALHLENGVDLHATVDARPTTGSGPMEQLEGEVVDVRQQIVEPTKGSVLESAMDLQVGDNVVSVGGGGAFIEEYEAELVRLENASE